MSETRLGVETYLWDTDAETTEYNQDCSQYQLAVKVGLFGVLLSIATTVTWEFIWFVYYESDYSGVLLLSQALGLLNPMAFTGSLLRSIGFVGVFALKRSKIGIIFPLIVFTSQFSWVFFLHFGEFFGIHFTEILYGYNITLSILLAIISCLALLTIRRVSANPNFLTFYAFYYIAMIGLSYLLSSLSSFLRWDMSGLSYFISRIPTLVLSFVSAILVIVFFTLESRMGCVDPTDGIHSLDY
ncbi:MAG: hypothetical protein ACFFEK_04340 [Candidatus Thorarchaeota archaeon]